MKNNKQRCSNCIHRHVCIQQPYYAVMEGKEKCKHYYPKVKLYGKDSDLKKGGAE